MKFAKCLSLLTLALLFAGCAGYQRGSNLSAQYRTVSLTVENLSDEPSVEVAVMKALRAEVQQDGRLALRRTGAADTILDVKVVDYYLSSLAYDRTHGRLTREYRVNLRVRAVLYNATTGEVLREIPSVVGDTDFPYDADLTSGKLASLSSAAKDVARKIVAQTIAAW